jgi:hypothetical protein
MVSLCGRHGAVQVHLLDHVPRDSTVLWLTLWHEWSEMLRERMGWRSGLLAYASVNNELLILIRGSVPRMLPHCIESFHVRCRIAAAK